MQVTAHVYRCHITEDPGGAGAMHPGGTNIYFVGDPRESMVVIDTGEHYREWTRRILAYHQELGSPAIDAILVTHGHGDHIGGLDRVQDAMGCPVRCHPRLVQRLARSLGEGSAVPLRSREVVRTGGGVGLRALFTPGHEEDHVCYYLPRERVMFTGDTILGASTTTVSDLGDYMRSLELLEGYRPRTICPGHGPIVKEAAERIRSYIAHRQRRELQVLEALQQGYATLDSIAQFVYPRNLRKELKEAAARNVRTHLAKLKSEGRVEETPASYVLSSPPWRGRESPFPMKGDGQVGGSYSSTRSPADW